MELSQDTIKIGDYVKVKKGVKAPDFEYQLMDGWQGKIIDIHDSKLVDIEWDTMTLLETSDRYLTDIIKHGYDYQIMSLEISDLERANRRDNEIQRKEAQAKIDGKLYWIELFEDEDKSKKYGKLFSGIKFTDYNRMYQKWEEYLLKNLKFPFEVKVRSSERGRIKYGDIIKLLDIEDYDEMYGIFGIGKFDREAVTYPICDLEAMNQDSRNYELLRDYCIWFADK